MEMLTRIWNVHFRLDLDLQAQILTIKMKVGLCVLENSRIGSN